MRGKPKLIRVMFVVYITADRRISNLVVDHGYARADMLDLGRLSLWFNLEGS